MTADCPCRCHRLDVIAADLRADLAAADQLRAELDQTRRVRVFLDACVDGVQAERERVVAGRLRTGRRVAR